MKKTAAPKKTTKKTAASAKKTSASAKQTTKTSAPKKTTKTAASAKQTSKKTSAKKSVLKSYWVPVGICVLVDAASSASAVEIVKEDLGKRFPKSYTTDIVFERPTQA